MWTRTFEQAYENQEQELIKSIYSYADWCIINGGKNGEYLSEAGTAAVVAFYEYIPTVPKARDEMHLFFSRADFLSMADTFSYLLDDNEFKKLKKEFLLKKDKMKL